MHLNPEITARMEGIQWFCHCGEPFQVSLSMPVNFVSSWQQASKYYHASAWDYATLEARNVLTEHLSYYHRERYRQWNIITGLGRDFLEEKIKPKIVAVQTQHGQDEAFSTTVNWDLLGAIMEDAYRDCDPPLRFFGELLDIYEAGHFPCGWKEGKWPLGKLVVF
jgi:hypothetical protein